jgi:transcriptional regulator of acetoin/glycerol metabolism
VDVELLDRRRSLEQVRSGFRRDPAAAPVREELRRSWSRCVSSLPVALSAAPVDEVAVEERWDSSPIRRALPDLVEQLRQVAEEGDFVAAVTDETGRILWSTGGRTMLRKAESVNFVAGGRWDEGSAGTNAPGLALINRAPATVFSVEHWCEAVHDWVCYAAPVRTADGVPVGAIDLSTVWERHTPLGLATVTALARLVEAQLPATAPSRAADRLELRLLGSPSVVHRGVPLLLPLRQLEILTVLAVAGNADLDTLHAHLYGDRRVGSSTLKAEISHLRRALDGAIASRPYRLALDCDVDVLHLLADLRRGALGRAAELYGGQLLSASDAPFVVEQRHHLDVALRTALLRDGSPPELLRFAEVHPWDTEVLERALAVASPGDPLVPLLTARLDAAALEP